MDRSASRCQVLDRDRDRRRHPSPSHHLSPPPPRRKMNMPRTRRKTHRVSGSGVAPMRFCSAVLFFGLPRRRATAETDTLQYLHARIPGDSARGAAGDRRISLLAPPYVTHPRNLRREPSDIRARPRRRALRTGEEGKKKKKKRNNGEGKAARCRGEGSRSFVPSPFDKSSWRAAGTLEHSEDERKREAGGAWCAPRTIASTRNCKTVPPFVPKAPRSLCM